MENRFTLSTFWSFWLSTFWSTQKTFSTFWNFWTVDVLKFDVPTPSQKNVHYFYVKLEFGEGKWSMYRSVYVISYQDFERRDLRKSPRADRRPDERLGQRGLRNAARRYRTTRTKVSLSCKCTLFLSLYLSIFLSFVDINNFLAF
jgi:hypothetical protein